MDFAHLSTQNIIYLILSGLLIIAILLGIFLMSKVKHARLGNALSAIAMLAGIIIVLIFSGVFNFDNMLVAFIIILISLIIGGVIGLVLSKKVKMIEMPQLVALLNGLGGASSALVGIVSFALFNGNAFALATSALAITVGLVTLCGSAIAAMKLHRLISQKQVVLKNHQLMLILLLIVALLCIILPAILIPLNVLSHGFVWLFLALNIVASSLFGILFAIRVGGADMPIAISLLNSFSGVAGAIAGLALRDVLLVAVGGIVGASGLILTQIMCKAINRSLIDILFGRAKKVETEPSAPVETKAEEKAEKIEEAPVEDTVDENQDPYDPLRNAKNVIIVPGYGMAIAQAQHLVKEVADILVSKGAKVRYAIHPVAGRMPGHMNVLLCEADVDYEDLFEMSDINDDFANADCVIVVGANDVLNPAANTAVGTPIYGMPVLKVADCKNIYIYNYDTKPGYAGVDNPLYQRKSGVHLFLGDAKATLQEAVNELRK